MNWDISLPSLLGYFATSLFNPNNVAAEGSPVTTELEIEVGKQLCQMLGYHTEIAPVGWGHITSCGSVANIESMWAARNVRTLPIAIKNKLIDLGLNEALSFPVELANESIVPLNEVNNWDLINIPSDSALKLLFELTEKYPKYAEQLLDMDVQHTGMGVYPTGVVLVPSTRHYSWDKAAALIGIGRHHLRFIHIDKNGRLDVIHLRRLLEDCLKTNTPVYQVVAVVGSTSESAVDPITQILSLRSEFRQKGLDFYLHADAAWGGYFCTALDSKEKLFIGQIIPNLKLSRYVQTQLESLKDVDSITVDPHKSGYIQYPAGALCYRNSYIRNLLSFKAPVVYNGVSDRSMGLYGVEGSKPGAAVAAVYLHHKVIQLDPSGHGNLLRQVHFTTKKLFALLATLYDEGEPVRIVPYQGKIEAGVLKRLKELASKSNNDFNQDDIDLLQEIGPDLLINGFCINFEWPLLNPRNNRKENKSLSIANRVIDMVAADLNISSPSTVDDTTTPIGTSRKKLFLIRSEIDPITQIAVYDNLLPQLGLPPELNVPLKFLINSNMDPWPTASGFLETFKHELNQSILRGIGAVMEDPHLHGFVAVDAGGAEVFGDHLPVFSEPQHNYHLIVKIAFESEEIKNELLSIVKPGLNKPLIVTNRNNSTLHDLIYLEAGFQSTMFIGFPSNDTIIPKPYKVTVTDIIRNEHFDPKPRHPSRFQYFIFGRKGHIYMSHIIVFSKEPDFHHLVEIKGDFDPILLELGFEATITGPDNIDNTRLPPVMCIEYVGKNRELISTKINCVSTHWYDSEHLNVRHDHIEHHSFGFAHTKENFDEFSHSTLCKAVFFDIGDTLGRATIVDEKLKLELFENTLQILKEFKALNIPVGVISNTPDTWNFDQCYTILAPITEFDSALIEKSLCIFSSVVHVEKPNARIFKIARQSVRIFYSDNTVKARDIVFIGESKVERAAATNYGFRVGPTISTAVSVAKKE